MEHELLPVSDRNGVRSQQSGPTPPSDRVAVTVGEPPQSPEVSAFVHRMEGLAEYEVRSVLWLEQEGNEVLARAYALWDQKDTLIESRIDRKMVALPTLRNEIYQLIGFYSVFQGVLFTAVAQSSLLYCYNWWTVFFLSLFVSLVTIAGVILKFWSIWEVEQTIRNEAVTRKVCIVRKRRLLQKRGDFNFDLDAERNWESHFKRRFKWSFVFVTVILVVFSTFFLISIYRVLCHPHAPAPTAAAS